MANIDLTNFYRKRNEKVSFVDSEILLNKADTDNTLYSDVKFDFEFDNFKEKQLNAKESNKDLTRIVNEKSVISSLKNILNTTRNTRILNPDIEIDLRQYLFDELSPTKAWFIGYEICSKIPHYEPRVSIRNVNIGIDWNNDAYVISLEIVIPSLGKNIKLTSILDKEGLSTQ